MIDRIRLRRDSSTNWSTYNPVLSSGEPGVELDTNRIKIGNGTSTWNNLPYILADVSGLELSIGNGFDTEIQWDISEKLNFKGSGDIGVLFNNSNNTITVYSLAGSEGLIFSNVSPQQILFKNNNGDIVGTPFLTYKELEEQLTVKNFYASGNIMGVIDGGGI